MDKLMGLNGDSPWWAKFAVRFGVPTVAAAILTAIIVRAFLGDLAQTKATSASNAQQLAHIASMSASHVEQTRQGFDRLELLLRQICVNTSTTSVDRRACFDLR